MNDNNRTVSDADLHRFVDGELNEADTRLVTRLVAEDASLRSKVESYREINRKLGEAFDSSSSGPLPSRFLIALAGRKQAMPRRVAAVVSWMVLGVLLGYTLHGSLQPDTYLRPLPVEAAFAHAVYVPEVRHPVEVGAAEQEHLNAWLSKRLERPISAPDLRQAGYALIGGRLLPDARRPAAQFMFENASGKRATLYIRHVPDDRVIPFTHDENEGLGVVYWVDRGLAYALAAAAERSTLSEVAELVHRQLSL